MSVCTFFGHRDCPDSVEAELRSVLVMLIEKYGVDTFLVGNHGAFDAMVCKQLQDLKQQYQDIDFFVILAYLPNKGKNEKTKECVDSIYPEGVECVPRRFAINWRNNWMLCRAEYVVAYVRNSFGGAWNFVSQAVKMKKTVIYLNA